jgi:putative endonuclease
MWYVYIVECADKTLYTGYTDDLPGRVCDHNESRNGAKYTRARRPVVLVYRRGFRDRSRALKEEYRIKQLSRVKKLALIEKFRKNY